MRPSLPDVIQIAREAGKIILHHYQSPAIQVSHKEDHSPLTIADQESDQWIQAELSRLTPSIPILSEESAIPPYEERKSWKKFWLVDPLDGTREFLKRNGEFTVNIALIEEGVSVLGVIFVPFQDLLYFGEQGSGAWKQVGEEEPQRISFQKADPSKPLTVVISRSHISPQEEAFLKTLSIGETLRIGSSLKFGLLAEGVADVYPRNGPTMEWDVAAGDCLYRAAAKGDYISPPFTYNKPDLRNDSFVLGMEASDL